MPETLVIRLLHRTVQARCIHTIEPLCSSKYNSEELEIGRDCTTLMDQELAGGVNVHFKIDEISG
jgi:hypothetical protein